MRIYYLGTFPPPFGGVTTKNLNLYTALSKNTEIWKIDFSKIKSKNIVELLRLISALFNRNNIFAIGVAGQKTRKRFCKLLYYMNRKAMSRSLIFLMGGSVSHDIAADTEYQKYIAAYKAVYVETKGMKSELENVGLNNIQIYPNCRFKPQKMEDTEYKKISKLSCVFFSLIQEKKGVDNIITAAKELPNIDFAFYGHIDDDYKEHFTNATACLPNVKYMGVFTGDCESVYRELAKYDVLLLPTKWKTEGIPGILVEAKIAGITCIVSDESYNAEIIKNGEEGIVLSENTPERLKEAIIKLDTNKKLLNRLKSNNYASAEKYYIEDYIDQIEKIARGGVTHRKLKTVFFSRVSPDKGIDLVLDAAKLLLDVEFHIYGEMDDTYSAAFVGQLSALSNTVYHGVFQGKEDDVYDELSKYDVMLLSTKWKHEGIPGILVEAKIAGIPAIVSDVCYNAEIVEDGVNGIVLQKNTVEKLTEAIARLDKNREMLYNLKTGAKRSAEKYYIENYISDICVTLRGGGGGNT